MNRWRRFARFNAVGLLGVGVQLAALWLLADVVRLPYLVATMAAVGLAVLHNFAWHWRWTWRDRAGGSGIVSTFARFAGAAGVVSFAGNLGVMSALVSGANIRPVVAGGVAIGVCGLLNFWLGNEVVFRSVTAYARPATLSPASTPLGAGRTDRDAA